MKIAIIGAGNMGGAIAKGLAQGTVIAAGDIWVSNPSLSKLDDLKAFDSRINTTTDNQKSRRCCRLGDLGCETVVDRYGGEID